MGGVEGCATSGTRAHFIRRERRDEDLSLLNAVGECFVGVSRERINRGKPALVAQVHQPHGQPAIFVCVSDAGDLHINVFLN